MKELNRNLRPTEKAAGHKTVDDASEHKSKFEKKKKTRNENNLEKERKKVEGKNLF